MESKYHREIKPGVFVDVYDVLHAWGVINPALQHLIKKALQPGELLRMLPAAVAAMGGELTRTPDLIDNAKEQA